MSRLTYGVVFGVFSNTWTTARMSPKKLLEAQKEKRRPENTG